MNNFVVDESNANVRIDQYLSSVTDYSRSKVVKLIKNGLVLVDDETIKPSYIVKVLDNIQIIGELKDKEYMDYILSKLKCDVIFHCAA